MSYDYTIFKAISVLFSHRINEECDVSVTASRKSVIILQISSDSRFMHQVISLYGITIAFCWIIMLKQYR